MPPPEECGCTEYMQGARKSDSLFCIKTETKDKVICVPPLTTPDGQSIKNKHFKKMADADKMKYMYCGASNFRICDAKFDPPSPPMRPLFTPHAPPTPSHPPRSANAPVFPPLRPISYYSQSQVGNDKCSDKKGAIKCQAKKFKGKCLKTNVQLQCAKTCGMICHLNGQVFSG